MVGGGGRRRSQLLLRHHPWFPLKPSRQCRLLSGRLDGGWFGGTSRLSVGCPWVPVCLLETPSIVPWLPRGIQGVFGGRLWRTRLLAICIKASSDFAARVPADSEHPLHEELSKTRSHTSTRSRFILLPSKTAAYRNSVLPALSRLLVDRNAELNYYIQELS